MIRIVKIILLIISFAFSSAFAFFLCELIIKSWNDITISFLADLASLLGIIIAFITYFHIKTKEEKEKKAQITFFVSKLGNQLLMVGSYAKGLRKNDKYIGYPEDEQANWEKNKWKSRCNPFQSVIRINPSELPKLPLEPLPILSNIPINQLRHAEKTLEYRLIEYIDRMNAQINILNFFLEEIRSFKFSRPASENTCLSNNLINANKMSDLKKDDQDFALALLNMNIYLHFNLIGDDNKIGLYSLVKEIEKLLNKLVKKYSLPIDNLDIFNH